MPGIGQRAAANGLAARYSFGQAVPGAAAQHRGHRDRRRQCPYAWRVTGKRSRARRREVGSERASFTRLRFVFDHVALASGVSERGRDSIAGRLRRLARVRRKVNNYMFN